MRVQSACFPRYFLLPKYLCSCPGSKNDPNLPAGHGLVYKIVVEESDAEKYERRRSIEAKVTSLAKDARPEAKLLFAELQLGCFIAGLVNVSFSSHFLKACFSRVYFEIQAGEQDCRPWWWRCR